MFHARDGLFFEALPYGDVVITVTNDGKRPDAAGSNVIFKTTLQRGTMASIMATASARGYGRETFYEAYEYLQTPGDPLP